MGVMRTNPRGLVVEMILPARSGVPTDKPRSFRQIVIFDGYTLERGTTDAARTKHWQGSAYGEGEFAKLNILDKETWLGRWFHDHDTQGYVLHGKPFLIEANDAEMVEIRNKKMPRAVALRIDKARTEVGAAVNPWTGE